jgi:hypothetical protein
LGILEWLRLGKSTKNKGPLTRMDLAVRGSKRMAIHGAVAAVNVWTLQGSSIRGFALLFTEWKAVQRKHFRRRFKRAMIGQYTKKRNSCLTWNIT